MIVLKCDKCGRLSEPSEKEYGIKGFVRIRLNIGSYGGTIRHLCDECRKKLGLPEEKAEDAIGERLIDILSEIACDAVEH